MSVESMPCSSVLIVRTEVTAHLAVNKRTVIMCFFAQLTSYNAVIFLLYSTQICPLPNIMNFCTVIWEGLIPH